MKRAVIFLALILALTFSGCSIPKSNGNSLGNQKPDGQIATTSSLNLTAFDDLFNNASSYENKRVIMSGYVYSADIKGNFITGVNQSLNLRDKPDMNTNLNMSMKITSQLIRKALIDEYNNKRGDWVKVEVSGAILLVKRPGLSKPAIILNVDNLIIKEDINQE